MFSRLIPSDILNTLYEHEEFCTKLGKVTLFSSKLEKQLLILLRNDQKNIDDHKPSMAMLIKYIDKKEVFPAIIPALNRCTEQNIDFLLMGVIENEIVLNDDENSFIQGFIHRIVKLENKISIIYNMIKEHNKISL